MTRDELKLRAARAALQYVVDGGPVGIGTGSTVDHFIDALAAVKDRVSGAVPSSRRSAERLRRHGIAILEANAVEALPVYIDGADEIDPLGHMIKGGGGALTGEKVVADLAVQLVCIADETKLVPRLGVFPLPIEVIPMAAQQVARRARTIGGTAKRREGLVTDSGNLILDVHGLAIADPAGLESEINQWPGVVTVGIFARHKASVCLVGTSDGVRTLRF